MSELYSKYMPTKKVKKPYASSAEILDRVWGLVGFMAGDVLWAWTLEVGPGLAWAEDVEAPPSQTDLDIFLAAEWPERVVERSAPVSKQFLRLICGKPRFGHIRTGVE